MTSGPGVLVVSDDQLEESAALDEFDVTTVPGAAEALDRLEDEPFACVVAPARVGIQFVRDVRRDHHDVPVVLYGTDLDEMCKPALEAGATDVVEMPSASDLGAVLADRVRVAMERHRVEHVNKRFFEAVPDPVVDITFEGDTPIIEHVNSTFVEVFGFDREEVLGESLTAILVPDGDQGTHRDIVRRAIAGEPVEREVRRRTVVGDRDFWLRVVPYPGGAFGWYSDVTDRNRYQQRLEELNVSSQRLIAAKSLEEVVAVTLNAVREVLAYQGTSVWRYDPAADVLVPMVPGDGDAELERLTEDAVIGADAFEMQVFRAGEPVAVEDYRVIENPGRPDSSLNSLLVVPIGDFGQLHVGSPIAGSFDTSERRLVEVLAKSAALALERVRFERALSDLHDVTRELLKADSRDRIYELAVTAGRDLLGLPLTHVYVVSDDGERLVPAAASTEMYERFGDLPTFDRGDGLLWNAYEAGETLLFDDVQEIDGMASDLPLRGAIASALGDHGVFGCASLIPADFDVFDRELTSLLAAATQVALDRADRDRVLFDREAALEQQNERLEEFASVISHDLRNPLTVANGHLELARREVDNDHLATVASALDRMESMIVDLLTLAREGNAVDETEPVSVRDLAESCWGNVETEDAALSVETDMTIVADKSRLRHVFENLFRNAVEHGDPPVTVRVGDLEDGFFVEDDGPGVPPDQRERVFETGYTTGHNGTGFGLKIVEGIVEAHSWSVTLTESDAGGARFEVRGVTTP